jgi:uncharacterized protein YdcH (DUF465 family)
MKVETAGTQENAALSQLIEEHRRYSEKLEGLMQAPYLSAEDHLEEVRLKKLKLRVKDAIAGNRPYQLN